MKWVSPLKLSVMQMDPKRRDPMWESKGWRQDMRSEPPLGINPHSLLN